MSDDDDTTWIYWVMAIVMVIVISLGVSTCVQHQQDECKQRGGHVIHVHNTQDWWSWACYED